MLKTLLLGDNAFIGVSHLSERLAREKVEKLQIQTIIKVIDKAVKFGATGFTFSTHPTNYQILKTLKEEGGVDDEFEIYPVLPYAEGYVRVANEKGTAGLIADTLSRLSLTSKAKTILKGAISAVKLDPASMLRAYVDMEVGSYLDAKPKNALLRSILLHEVITDLAISFDTKHLLQAYMDYVRDNYQVQPGFVTRNFASFVRCFLHNELELKDVVIMTPFNKMGFQMNPSREACESNLSSLTGGNVIAMSVLASGFLPLHEALEYVGTLRNLSGVAIGASSKEHAEQTFSKLRRLVIA